jgi:glycosyltransferase involved in cell wall biosynthesis
MISSHQNTTAVVIAAFNEEQVIVETCATLKDQGFAWDVIVVDDGSSDQTSEKLKETTATAIRHPINMGQGAALQTGITYALRAGYKEIITFDADGQHSPEDALAMRDFLRKHSDTLDLVIGSRFLKSSDQDQVPTKKQIVLKLATWFTRVSTGLNLTDTHNGLRVLSRRAAEKIQITQNGMAHASEILDLIAKHKLHYAEFPTTVHYTEYSMNKGQKISNSLNILWDLFTKRMKQ